MFKGSGATTRAPIGITRHLLRLLAIMLTWPLATPVVAASGDRLELQRDRFLKAYEAVTHGRPQDARAQWSQLQGYVLLPYLEYEDLWRNLSRRSDQEILSFLDREGETLLAERLRTLWLRRLAQTGDWQTFTQVYTPQSSERLVCEYLSARAKKEVSNALLEDIRKVWLTGDSVDARCDPAFDALYQSSLMTDDLLWARMQLAIAANRMQLAGYLARKLKTPSRVTLANQWIALRAQPKRFNADTQLTDLPEKAGVIVDLIHRRSREDLDGTLKLWPAIVSKHGLTAEHRSELVRHLALAAHRADHAMAMQLLTAIEPEALDSTLEQARLSRAIQTRDWPQLLAFTASTPRDPDNVLRWRYWHARALEESGAVERAAQAFAQLAKERDYYGFLAADRIDAEYRFNDFPVAPTAEESAALRARQGVARSLELFTLGLEREAGREWWFAVQRLSSRELEVLAAHLAEAGQHHRAIVTIGRARSYDDLSIRFPLLHREHVDLFARRRGLEAATIFGVIRTESAFLVDARSGAGARGLMQLMPATAAETAKRIDLRYQGPSQLSDPHINIMLGSAYLQGMLQRFDNNLALAAAAYNAGPHRARAWRPATGCVPLDIWVEQVPFAETRSYVRRLLFHTVVYAQRMGQPTLRVSALARDITPEKGSSARC